jgi:hypothetical protein
VLCEPFEPRLAEFQLEPRTSGAHRLGELPFRLFSAPDAIASGIPWDARHSGGRGFLNELKENLDDFVPGVNPRLGAADFLDFARDANGIFV